MKTKNDKAFLKIFDTIPEGCMVIKNHGQQPALHLQEHAFPSIGKGCIDIYPLFQGIELSHHRYLTPGIRFCHSPKPQILEINYCRQGRIGWNMCKENNVYLGNGEICIHSLSSCADSEMTLPLGFYEGIAMTIDLHQIVLKEFPLFQEIAWDPQKLYEHYCIDPKNVILQNHPQFQSIFSSLFTSPITSSLSYFRLKCMELLLLLSESSTEDSNHHSCDQRQYEQIQTIRQFLIDHIDQRFTIEELAKKYLMNTSTLKADFKAVYGLPIAAYMKEYRLQLAAQLLRESDLSIQAIAEQVGYESQGKFSKAFKERMQQLPSQYRKERY